MISLKINSSVNFEKGIEDWNLSRLTDYIDLNDEKKDAVCGLICQGVDIFKDDIISVASKEIQKKSFGKNLEVKDIKIHNIGQELILEVVVQAKDSQETQSDNSFFSKAISLAVKSTSKDKVEKMFINLINTKMINERILDTVSGIMERKKIPVEVKSITCA